jgi:hypothetical protein
MFWEGGGIAGLPQLHRPTKYSWTALPEFQTTGRSREDDDELEYDCDW